MEIKLNVTAVNLKYKELSTPQEITLDLGLKDLVIIGSACSEKTLNAEKPLISEPFVLLSKYEFDNLLSKVDLLRKILSEIKTLSK